VPASVLETRAKKLRGFLGVQHRTRSVGVTCIGPTTAVGVAQDLRAHPILAVGAVQITAQHAEAVSQCSWVSMEEGFFLYRVALDAADIAPGQIQRSTPVVANLANPQAGRLEFCNSARRQNTAPSCGRAFRTVDPRERFHE